MSVTFGEATSQSVGGAGSTTTSSETMVSVTVNQAVEATGAGAFGVFAQSVGDGMGAIAVEIAKGASVTGGGAAAISGASDGAGVYIRDGTSASLTVAEGAALSSVRGTAGNALVADGADVTVTNAGTITGSVVNAACEVGGASRRIVSRRHSSS